jgi:hypothetical protein
LALAIVACGANSIRQRRAALCLGIEPFFFVSTQGEPDAMPKILEPGQAYSSRRPDAIVVNTALDADAVEVLKRYCPPGRKTTGKFLARLLYEFDARQQERQRLHKQIAAVLRGEAEER